MKKLDVSISASMIAYTLRLSLEFSSTGRIFFQKKVFSSFKHTSIIIEKNSCIMIDCTRKNCSSGSMPVMISIDVYADSATSEYTEQFHTDCVKPFFPPNSAAVPV